MLGAILSLFAPVVLGSSLAARLLGRSGAGPLVLGAGLVLGLGAAGILSLGALVLGVPFGVWRAVEIGVALVAALVAGDAARRRLRRRGDRVPRPRFSRVLGAAVLVAGLAGLALVVLAAVRAPHGDWDAWAIWNLRARFLFRGGGAGAAALATALAPELEWSHLDYPLLLPALVARGWVLDGGEGRLVAPAIGLAFLLAAACTLHGGLRASRGEASARLGLLLLLATPAFLLHAVSGYADIPLSADLALAFVALRLCRLADAPAAALAIAGAASGLAALTKHEGLLLGPVLALQIALPLLARRPAGRAALGRLASTAAGLALPGLALALWTRASGGPGALAAAGSLERLGSLARHGRVLLAVLRSPVQLARWSVAPIAGLLLPILLGLDRSRPRASVELLLLLLIVLAGYHLALVAGSGPIDWLVNVTLDRFLIQLCPVLLFVSLSLARPVSADGGPAGLSSPGGTP
jgi:hypothetical protein